MIFHRKPAKNYFIDSENVNDVWVADIVNGLEERDHIYIFYSENSTHMKSDSVRRLMELGNDRVTWIRCYIGTNALDFQLVTVLGSVVTESKNNEAIIVSNDAGYDAVVQFWQDQGHEVSRMKLDTSAGKSHRTRSVRKPAKKIQSQRPNLNEQPKQQAKQQPKQQPTPQETKTRSAQAKQQSQAKQASNQPSQSKQQTQSANKAQPASQNTFSKQKTPAPQNQPVKQAVQPQTTKEKPKQQEQQSAQKTDSNGKQPQKNQQTRAQSGQPKPITKAADSKQPSGQQKPATKAADPKQQSGQPKPATKAADPKQQSGQQKLITKAADPKQLPVPEQEPSERDKVIYRSLCRSIPADDTSRIHDALQVLLGSRDGMTLYNYVKKHPQIREQARPLLLPDEKSRQSNYVELICAVEGLPEDASRSLASIYTEEKQNGLQAVNLAMVKEFGQEKAQLYYPVLKRHYKILDKISQ